VSVVRVADVADLPAVLDDIRHGHRRPMLLPPVVVELDDVDAADPKVLDALDRYPGVVVGHATRPVLPGATQLLESLTCSTAPSASGRCWVDGPLEPLIDTVARSPRAAAALVGLLRVTTDAPVLPGLAAESACYSMLLAGPEFARWRASRVVRPVPEVDEPVLVERDGSHLLVTLNRPERRNAFGRAVRDGLLAALEVARLDDSITEVELRGRGAAFCSGGDLDEFGTATDVTEAHVVRLLASAGAAVHRLRDRVVPRLQGACIGAGIEVPAFADRVVASRDAWFQLPELSLGLVPGAGGTVSITRRIGRWRTAYLALSGRRIGVATALEWGLVDELET
jgi:hypothetical protein